MPEYQYPPVDAPAKPETGSPSDGRERGGRSTASGWKRRSTASVSAPSVTEITRGPTVTRYDLELEAGVKLSKLTNLAGDLALSLGVVSVRIAPIPDKISTVGVEVPNKVVSTVYLRDIIDSPAFQNAASKLSLRHRQGHRGQLYRRQHCQAARICSSPVRPAAARACA